MWDDMGKNRLAGLGVQREAGLELVGSMLSPAHTPVPACAWWGAQVAWGRCSCSSSLRHPRECVQGSLWWCRGGLAESALQGRPRFTVAQALGGTWRVLRSDLSL